VSQPVLFEQEFRTARPPRPVYCHQEFLDKLAARRNEPVGKRAALMLQQMAVDISRLHYKGTHGVNRGWRRSRLGGSSGSHFYAWWAPATATPLKDSGFQAESEAIVLRDIRHHDDHAPLNTGDSSKDYLLLTVPDLRGTEYAPEPWTSPQARFASGRATARILKGHPGSGKTTALLHAADASRSDRVLYLTFSQDLAALARDYFDRFCSSQTRTFTVLTYPAFLSQLLGGQTTPLDILACRAQFRRDLFNHQRSLGVWSNNVDALYDEMHAHLVGAAVPQAAGRFPKAEHVRLPDGPYRTQRNRYLGPAADTVLDAAHRLERSSHAPLADLYFPELALAWRAASALSSGSRQIESSFLDYGCIAVDEVQDLTPLEAFVLLALACRFGADRSRASLLLAGDEAQTVRPTDFEWAWLNDMLHSMIGQAQEFKLTVNLRSPRRIADVVNRVWDLYDYLHKQERPSGTGYAEIDDDGPDQILYATVARAEVPALLNSLITREGLAMVAFDKENLPGEILPFVLSPAEAKGLDFHSVCVLNGGSLLQHIVDAHASAPTDSLTRRLAIDQLRVALSRPTERLLWVDVAPQAPTVKEVARLLRPPADIALYPVTAEALRTGLEEDQLDIEERLQRCQKDARQLLSVKPDLAWSRAQQAVRLLGLPGDLNRVTDAAAREATYLMLAEVAFQLGFRRKSLSPELGRLDLYEQSAEAARSGGKLLLANAIQFIGAAEKAQGPERLNRIATAIQEITAAGEQLPAWLIIEITPSANFWLDELDHHLEAGDNPILAQEILPPFFDALGLPDAQARKDRLAQRAVQILMKTRRHAQALKILGRLPEPNQKLTAECYEETEQFAKAAEVWMQLRDRDRALKCYRSIPDFGAALNMVREIENHPARPSLEWLAEVDALFARRPDNFNRTMTAPEKKLLEATLERGLGVQRKKPAPKKKAPATTVKNRAPKKRAAAKRMPLQRDKSPF
jgi:tetratricopeptide (TPR) repeat protein